MPSASGTAVHSARWKSFMTVLLNHLFALASTSSPDEGPAPAQDRASVLFGVTACRWLRPD